jgi:hypothetical protein
MTDTVLEDEEANRITAELAAKYGNDALEFVRSRAERAQSVGDELAYGAWQSVLDATEALLGLKSIPAE